MHAHQTILSFDVVVKQRGPEFSSFFFMGRGPSSEKEDANKQRPSDSAHV